MSCKGMHCDGCRHGGGGAAGAVIALLVIVALALRKSWPEVISAAEIAGWTIAAVTGTAILITGGVLTARAARRRAARRAAAYRHPTVINGIRVYEPVPPAGRRAVGAPRGTGSWPQGWRADIRPRAGSDGDEHRSR